MKKLTSLPDGVTVVKHYPGLKATIVACAHAEGFRREHGGGMAVRCRFCKGDAQTTNNFALPVKVMADLDLKAIQKDEAQVALF